MLKHVDSGPKNSSFTPFWKECASAVWYNTALKIQTETASNSASK